MYMEMETEKTTADLEAENRMLRQEIKVAREAAAITARLVVKQFEKTDQTLHHLEAANAQRRAVLDATTQLSIISTDLNGRITMFNVGAANLLGFSQDEMVDKQNISVIHVKDELGQYAHVLTGVMPTEPIAIDVFSQHVKQHVFQAHEWTYLCKNGTLLPVNLSITAFYNARGIMRGYLFTAMDMSSQKQMKQELIQAMETAEAANSSKGDFLARMSHEIRTPMNGVIGMAHLMGNTPLNPIQTNYLDKIQTSARSLLNLINDILDFSKIDAGKLTLESIDFRLEDVLANVVNTIGFMAEEKGLEFLFQVDKNIPSYLKGDPLRLGQILMNLASNAIKFTEKGEIFISVTLDGDHDTNRDATLHIPGRASGTSPTTGAENSRTEHPHAKNGQAMLKFFVKDSGVGLHSEEIDSLFEAFSQADDSITRKYGGTGLGLSICSQLTRMMGGSIWVESRPDEGSTFIFTVKLSYSTPLKPVAVPEKNLFHGHRALVVDDNRAARELLVSMLESFGMEVDSAPDGKSALERLDNALEAKTPYTVVLLDWIMPGMDGIETARRIKANGDWAKIPAMLMVTANGREEARMAAEETGIKAFLMKPVYPSMMYNTLQEAMGLAPSPAESKTGPPPSPTAAMKHIRGARILLVEDNAINQEVALAFLEDVGMVVDIAEHGQACLDMMDKKPYDLILMDIQMPVLDGLATTRIIRNEKKLHQIPIIAMTAHAMAGDQEKSLKAGMNGHLNKPVNPGKLYQVLQQFIPEKPGEPGGKITKETTEAPPMENRPSKMTEAPPQKAAVMSSEIHPDFQIPPLKGINHAKALELLSHKPELLLTILQDFKKDYGDHPEYLKNLLQQKDFKKIRECAHTIKGISGYMAAEELFKRAAALEDHLKAMEIKDPPQPESTASPRTVDVSLVHGFINEIETMMDTLDQLPVKTVQPPCTSLKPGEERPLKPRQRITDLDKQKQKILKEFHALLVKGEFMAMDLLPDVEKILKECGYERELRAIMDLMDDIEFEQAADKMREWF